MWTLRCFFVLATAVILIVFAELCWYVSTRQLRITAHDVPTAEEDATNLDLPTATMRFREVKNRRSEYAIAKSFAASRTHLWEECARRMAAHEIDENRALVHFVSAYYQRGPHQKEELISLLHSQDVELVGGLLHLLASAFEYDPNGGWQPKSLGGAEIAHHIAGVYKTHPSLAWSIASALGQYGPTAKGEVRTILRIVLSSDDKLGQFGPIIALGKIDDSVCSQFGLKSLKPLPLTAEQRAAIEKYLAQEK